MGRHTILFVDEIHRFNKSQQDALLPYAESGLVTFIGATTENPSFEVNSALLSRAQVYVLQSLTDEELRQLLQRAQDKALGGLEFDDLARDTIIGYADGDARRFLNLLEQCQTAAGAAGVTRIDAEFVQNALTLNARRFDKGGDNFYDQISALHKSVRGSHPDAALYWLTRMLDGGADARYLSRRIVRMAWEDIGLADPRAMQIANDAALTYERLGSPEGELALGQAVIYLAMAAKSNAGYSPTPTLPARPICPKALRSRAGTSPCPGAWRSRSARSWPCCASGTKRLAAANRPGQGRPVRSYAPGPGSTVTSRACNGAWHSEQTMTGSKTWPHPVWRCSRGRPASPAMCTSPQCTMAMTTGCRSTPLGVSRYSYRTGASW
jgi:hypothetical protein